MIIFKVNVIGLLKKKGYTTYRLRNEKILSDPVLDHIRNNKPISTKTLGKICDLLDCQPGDIIAYRKDWKV